MSAVSAASSENDTELSEQQQKAGPKSFYPAIASTATRAIALYFARPVRLFRPNKLSGWQSLRNYAAHNGTSLSPQYILWLLRNKFVVLPKHFIPPVMVNAALGTVLWASYSQTSNFLEAHIGAHQTVVAALSGAMAGGMQAIAAAPAENVRLLMEGGSAKGSWSHAWKEVFRKGVQAAPASFENPNIQDARAVRHWVKEVRDMAGRGWDGWGWGLAKDMCGFAVFFSIFDITRRVATQTRSATEAIAQTAPQRWERAERFKRHAPRVIHGFTLVTGGVVAGLAYEVVSRPWDIARRTVYLDQLSAKAASPPRPHSPMRALLHKLKDDGITSFLANPSAVVSSVPLDPSARMHQRLLATARVLGRVGPWGIGFLVWESFGPGLA